MPYTKQERRAYGPQQQMTGFSCQERGDLNFCIMNLLIGYAKLHSRRYATFEDIDGALTEVGREFFRRVVAPYEDEKIAMNGDLDWSGLLPASPEW